MMGYVSATNRLGPKQTEDLNLEETTNDPMIADRRSFNDEEHVMGSNQAEGPIVRTEQESENLRTVKTRAQYGKDLSTKLVIEEEKEVQCRKGNKTDKLVPWAGNYNMVKLQQLQEEDEDIGPIMKAKQENKQQSSAAITALSPSTRHYWLLWDVLEVQDGVLFNFKKFIRKDGTGEHLQFIVP
ncbi:hypothetical protein ACJMK2_009057 [Sinanodonta woodiana]|uniref:Uncharacterized protein n=1 Tax=Sinanodonta woodiana TaxID=1069815 RepID=A0ABD3VB38_SINWO